MVKILVKKMLKFWSKKSSKFWGSGGSFFWSKKIQKFGGSGGVFSGGVFGPVFSTPKKPGWRAILPGGSPPPRGGPPPPESARPLPDWPHPSGGILYISIFRALVENDILCSGGGGHFGGSFACQGKGGHLGGSCGPEKSGRKRVENRPRNMTQKPGLGNPPRKPP